MKRLRPIPSLLTLFTLSSATAALPQDRTWIVTDRQVALDTRDKLEELDLIDSEEAVFNLVPSTGPLVTVEINRAGLGRLKTIVHREYNHCGGFSPHSNRAEARAQERRPAYQPNFTLSSPKFAAVVDQQAVVVPALDEIDATRIAAVVCKLESFHNRHYDTDNGQAASDYLLQLWESYTSSRSDITVRKVPHDDWKQDTVMARIEGRETPSEVVVIGAHLDSIYCVEYPGLDRTCTRDHPAPGADDDASGIAAVSEILRVVASSDFKPRRTIEFIAYAAEEEGLKGSRELIQKEYSGTDRQVIGAMQLDMVGFKGSEKDVYFVSDATSQQLTDFVKSMIATYNSSAPHRIEVGEDITCGYACSDHVSWYEEGVHTVFPFEANREQSNKKIHSEGDTGDHMRSIDSDHPLRFAKLGLEYVIEMAKGHTPQPPE